MKISTKYILALGLLTAAATLPVEAAPSETINREFAAETPTVKAHAGGIAIEVPGEEAVHVTIYALTGQVVKQTYVAPGQTDIELPTGYYIVRVGQTTAKVVVK